MQEVVLFYNGLDVPTRQILDSRGTIPSKTVADAKVPITPKIVHTRKKGKPSKKLITLNLVHLFKEGDIEQLLRVLPKEQRKPFIKEIRALMDSAIRNQGASIKTLEIQIGQMSKVLQERGFRSLPSFTKTNPRDHVKSISTIVEANASSIRYIGSHQYAVSTGQNSTLMYETKQMTIPFLSRLNNCHCEDKKGSYGP
ncbi:hypothetical protein Tco_1471393 [Tanacetum coccineum]